MKTKKQIEEVIYRLREATRSRTWSTLPEELIDAADELEQLLAAITERDGRISDLEERLQAWNNYADEVDRAILENGSYKP